jgi:hypothetical protein
MSETNSGRFYQHLSAVLLLALFFLIFFIAYNSDNQATLLFGDDSSAFANDGFCSDVRFRGPGMGDVSGLETVNDAADCTALFSDGEIFLASDQANLAIQSIEFGNDQGSFPNDDECDDPRFDGPGAFSGGDDVRGDATDCRNLLYQGAVSFVGDEGIQDRDDDFFGDELDLAELEFGDDASTWANDGECDDPRFAGNGAADSFSDEDAYHDATDCSALYASGDIFYVGTTWDDGGIIERGELEPSDEVYGETGEYMDSYFFDGSPEEIMVLDLHSNEFDTYLVVIAPNGDEFENDDFEGSTGWSQLTIDPVINGPYEVIVTSYSAGETGKYALGIKSLEVPETVVDLDVEGRLETGDEQMPSGEFGDSYEITALPGQMLTITLESDDFDAYLRLESPSGNMLTDDDGFGSGTDSMIEIDAAEFGTYKIFATSFLAHETGVYNLRVLSSVMDLPGL